MSAPLLKVVFLTLSNGASYLSLLSEKDPENQGLFVRVKGLEPPRLSAPEPKSGASANFATPAWNSDSLAKNLAVENSM